MNNMLIEQNCNNQILSINDYQVNTREEFLYKYGNYSIGNKIYEFINRDKMAKNSVIAYTTAIKQFFNSQFNVNTIDNITVNMIVDTTAQHGRDFIKELRNKKREDGTIAQKRNILHKLFKFLQGELYNNRKGIALLGGNPFGNIETPIKDQKSHDSFTKSEILTLIKTTPYIYSKLLYKLAIVTGVRLSALLSLDIRNNFKKINGIWYIYGWDKTQNYMDDITTEMYNECCKLAFENDGKVFNITPDGVDKRIKADCKSMGLSKEEIKIRKLSFHSLKKDTVVFTGLLSGGDLGAMQEKGHHNDPKTTKNIYDKHHKQNTYGLQIAEVILKDNNVDDIIKKNIPGMFTSEIVEMLCGLSDGAQSEVLDYIVNRNNKQNN